MQRLSQSVTVSSVLRLALATASVSAAVVLAGEHRRVAPGARPAREHLRFVV
jgi:hypothetical protein